MIEFVGLTADRYCQCNIETQISELKSVIA